MPTAIVLVVGIALTIMSGSAFHRQAELLSAQSTWRRCQWLTMGLLLYGAGITFIGAALRAVYN